MGNLKCDNCNSKQIYYDKIHDEVFCIECGIVLIQNFTVYLQENEEKDKPQKKK